MKRMIRTVVGKTWMGVSLLVLYFNGQAQTKLPAFFSDGMVLQQQQAVSIWGTDKRGVRVNVTASWGKTASAVADSIGRWKVMIQTPAAGGPYQVTVRGSEKKALQDVLIGEVWLCSGQSNMEMPVRGNQNQPVLGSNEAILQSSNGRIRFFNTAKIPALFPVNDVTGKWQSAGPATTGDCSATAYFFARKVNAVLGIPVGLIHTSWGASPVESWMDAGTLASFRDIVLPQQMPAKEPNKTPTLLYNGMVHPYIGYALRGVLWYQGEANRLNARQYFELFGALIRSWREQWKQGNFPFYFVQIAPFAYKDTNAAYLREAQLKVMQSVENTGMAVTLDIGEKNLIHPSRKMEVGERLAYWALAKTYGVKGIAFSGPVFRQMQVNEAGKAVLSFDHAGMGLSSFGKPLTGFEIAGEDKVFYPAEALINSDKSGVVTVWSEQVKKPVSVRYAFHSWTEASLFNTQGLPASSFRTDDW